MEWIVRLECRDKSRVLHEREVARFERQTDELRPEEVGLSLLDAKAVLHNIQWNLVRDQVALQAPAGRVCRHCGRNRRIKDYRERMLRTLSPSRWTAPGSAPTAALRVANRTLSRGGLNA